jgi:hypothetical protein
MSQSDQSHAPLSIATADNSLRTLLLVSFYAGAVFFAVVFSPSMGYSPSHHHAPLGQSASLR